MMTRMIAVLLLSVSAIAQTAHYRHHGPALLPDSKVTPGQVSDRTAAQLCDPHFHTGTVRKVSASTKKKACAFYGVLHCDGRVELDHSISLELGGTNDVSNLWPQPYAPTPGARQKDLVENHLHRQVCSKQMTLAEAQTAIRTDWYAIYLKMTKDQKKKSVAKR